MLSLAVIVKKSNVMKCSFKIVKNVSTCRHFFELKENPKAVKLDLIWALFPKQASGEINKLHSSA